MRSTMTLQPIQMMEVVIMFQVVQMSQHITTTPMLTLMMVLVLHLFMGVLIQYLSIIILWRTRMTVLVLRLF